MWVHVRVCVRACVCVCVGTTENWIGAGGAVALAPVLPPSLTVLNLGGK